jgi:hypothetical protein
MVSTKQEYASTLMVKRLHRSTIASTSLMESVGVMTVLGKVVSSLERQEILSLFLPYFFLLPFFLPSSLSTFLPILGLPLLLTPPNQNAHGGGIYHTYRIPFGFSIKITANLAFETDNTFWFIIRGLDNMPVIMGDLVLPSDARLKVREIKKKGKGKGGDGEDGEEVRERKGEEDQEGETV